MPAPAALAAARAAARGAAAAELGKRVKLSLAMALWSVAGYVLAAVLPLLGLVLIIAAALAIALVILYHYCMTHDTALDVASAISPLFSLFRGYFTPEACKQILGGAP